ncbi:uncharacterized protein LOC112057315 [Bicyclus anynana]|uniref:Uncharacterized protein LOC112057315 n=1 Tax=Bicyclus anynana TaxID=110368 RepID=A0A6J1P6W4_BICAN|nr:uncharacterized protein LOC112057315 [Bicyclus anynana]
MNAAEITACDDDMEDTVSQKARQQIIEDYLKNIDADMSESCGEDLRTPKRHRMDEDEGEWTTVGKKTKTDIIEIYISFSKILPKQFAFAKLLKNNNITEIEKVKYMSPFKIRLDVCEESAHKIYNCKDFIDRGWRIYRAMERDISHGVIKGVDLDLSSEDIWKRIECPSKIELKSVMRLNRRSESAVSGWSPSESVRLSFKGEELPPYVIVDGLKIKIVPFVFRVSQCSRCWRLGHFLRRCPMTRMVCPKCGGKHENCLTTSYKCVNCGGNHMAMSKICPAYLKEKKLRQIMAECNCTYKKALTIYTSSKEDIPTRPTSPVIPYTVDPNPFAPLSTDKSSYAEILKTSADIHTLPNNRKPPSSSTPKAARAQRRRTSEISVENSIRPDDVSWKEKDAEPKKKFPFAELLNRLKNILFLKGISMQDKLKSIVKCCLDWVFSALMEFLSDWSLLQTIIESFIKNG